MVGEDCAEGNFVLAFFPVVAINQIFPHFRCKSNNNFEFQNSLIKWIFF
jgi:hypothetical protein